MPFYEYHIVIEATILIIEDYTVLRRALRGWLEAVFPTYQIIEAVNHAEAFTPAQAQAPDVAIMSFGSLDGSNLQTVHQLKAHLPTMEIIVLASDDDEAHRAQAMAAGASVVVSAQNVTQELQQALTTLLSPKTTLKHRQCPSLRVFII